MSSATAIPLIFREKVEQEIIPQLLEAGKSVLAAHELDSDNFDNYFVGCACWNNIFLRLTRLCNESEFFSGQPYKNTLEVKAVADGLPISFYVARVDEKTRIPNAGKGIKRLAQECLFLSDEVRAIMESKGVFTLGYDINTNDGFGRVTFDMLTHVSRNNYQANPIFSFDVNIAANSYTLVQPEATTKPPLTREKVEEKNPAKEQAK